MIRLKKLTTSDSRSYLRRWVARERRGRVLLLMGGSRSRGSGGCFDERSLVAAAAHGAVREMRKSLKWGENRTRSDNPVALGHKHSTLLRRHTTIQHNLPMFLSRRWRRGERLLLAEHAAGGPRRRRGGRRPTPLRYLLERRPRGRQPGDARRRGRERGRRGAVGQRVSLN